MFDRLLNSLILINESYHFRQKASKQDPYLSKIDTTITIKLEPSKFKSHLEISYWQDTIHLDSDNYEDPELIRRNLIKYFRYYHCPIFFNDEKISDPLALTPPQKDLDNFEDKKRFTDLFKTEFHSDYSMQDPLIYINLCYPYRIDAWFYFSPAFNNDKSMRIFNSGIYQPGSSMIPDFLLEVNKDNSFIQGIISTDIIKSNSFIESSVKNFITKKLADAIIHTLATLPSSKEQALYWLKTSNFIKQACVLDIDFFTKIKEILFIELQNRFSNSKMLVSVDNFLSNISMDSDCYKDYTLSKTSSIDARYYSFLVETTGSNTLKNLYLNQYKPT